VCGKFPTWQDNVRAIALGLEALRKVDRYGIVQSAEQYRGWQALPPGSPMPAAKMTIEDAARLLADAAPSLGYESGDLLDSGAADGAIPRCYREAAKRLHPDVGGDPELFKRLTEARDLLVAS